MANDFSGESSCKALWSVDDGALTTDGKGSNTLTNNNTVTNNTVDFMEGDASADFEFDNSESLSITDANLDSGFPLKDGESNDSISVVFWFQLEQLRTLSGLFAKWDTGNGARSFYIRCNSTSLDFYIGTGTGATFELLSQYSSVAINKWYHVCATFNNTTKAWTLRVWDDTASSLVHDGSGTATSNIVITDAKVVLGASSTGGTEERFMDGEMDEIVVFDKILTPTDCEDIIAGTYTAGEPSGFQAAWARNSNQIIRIDT